MRRFKKNEIVYNWHYTHLTSELKCSEIVVDYYEYMDGMQWNVVDEYRCHREYHIPYWKIFKKTEREHYRVPGHLLHKDKLVAKIIILQRMLEGFGYILTTNYTGYSENLIPILKDAISELEELQITYPEKVLQAQVAVYADEKNSGSLWR